MLKVVNLLCIFVGIEQFDVSMILTTSVCLTFFSEDDSFIDYDGMRHTLIRCLDFVDLQKTYFEDDLTTHHLCQTLTTDIDWKMLPYLVVLARC